MYETFFQNRDSYKYVSLIEIVLDRFFRGFVFFFGGKRRMSLTGIGLKRRVGKEIWIRNVWGNTDNSPFSPVFPPFPPFFPFLPFPPLPQNHSAKRSRKPAPVLNRPLSSIHHQTLSDFDEAELSIEGGARRLKKCGTEKDSRGGEEKNGGENGGKKREKKKNLREEVGKLNKMK